MRYVVSLGLVFVLVASLVTIKLKQISALVHFGQVAQKNGPPPEVVGTTMAKRDSWEGTTSAVGSVTAVKGVSVSNDSPGLVTAIHFDSGDMVKAGQVLIELDTSVERAQLAAAQARKDLANLSAGRSRVLAGKAAISASQLDGDEAQLKSSAADEGALKAQIERKTVRAPFSGHLGIRAVNLGQYLNPGTAVTVLEALGSVYVDFSLPQQSLSQVPVGTPVRVTWDGGTAALDGAIAAADPNIDASLRTVKLRARVPNKSGALRPGMFVNVLVVRAERNAVVAVPATAIIHASYGDSVFVVEDKPAPADSGGGDAPGGKVARQQFVRVGDARGDFVAIATGVNEGQEVVTQGGFKVRNGSSVLVNNEVAQHASLVPHLEER